ncbi:MAG TPA: hypothetical protein PLD59_13150, partial [Tepidisphaeraceae bacterium]|nr:hypothetical protein [Tepidisphaeraceae bacterium]
AERRAAAERKAAAARKADLEARRLAADAKARKEAAARKAFIAARDERLQRQAAAEAKARKEAKQRKERKSTTQPTSRPTSTRARYALLDEPTSIDFDSFVSPSMHQLCAISARPTPAATLLRSPHRSSAPAA